jgi:hypothetical protein
VHSNVDNEDGVSVAHETQHALVVRRRARSTARCCSGTTVVRTPGRRHGDRGPGRVSANDAEYREDARPATAGSTSSRSENAEFVALRIGQNDRSLVALSDVGIRRAKVDQASHFSFLVVRTEIEMEPVLGGLRLRYSSEQQTGDLDGRRSDLEILRIVVHNDPAQRRRPPSPQRLWVGRVDDDLFPVERHRAERRAHRPIRSERTTIRRSASWNAGSASCLSALGRPSAVSRSSLNEATSVDVKLGVRPVRVQNHRD